MNSTIAIFTAATPLLGLAALLDLRKRRIPNTLAVGVLLLGALRIGLAGDGAAALKDVAWALAVFAGILVLWHFRWLGGGDAKLLSAAALLVGHAALANFLLLTILCGGALGVLAFIDRWFEDNYGWSAGIAFPRGDMTVRTPREAPTPKTTVPYGIAIAIGCLGTLFLSSTPF